MKEQLRKLILSRAVERKEEGFKLASGKISNLYIDLRRITQDPKGIRLIGELALDRIIRLAPDADSVGGLETGSIPIATAISLLSGEAERPLSAFWVRKSVKDHGMQNRIEGNLRHGSRAVIVDDTITTGGSSLQAVEAVRQSGAYVVLALAIIDRGAADSFEKAGVPYRYIFSEQDVS
jgi:orotate phosphoribosyltransferase